jgi:hypothetical protein
VLLGEDEVLAAREVVRLEDGPGGCHAGKLAEQGRKVNSRTSYFPRGPAGSVGL